jgi:multidrug efflux system membrane fusion protein
MEKPRLKELSQTVSRVFSKIKSLILPAGVSLLVLLLSSCAKRPPSGNAAMMMMMQAVPVRAVAATTADVPLNVSAVGTVEAIRSVDVKSRIAGQILRVDFEAGENVRQGQLLFEIDPEPTLAQIAQIKADLAKDSAMEQQARANAAKDQATLVEDEAAEKRAVALAKDGVISKEQLEQAVATAEGARAALKADNAAIESAVASAKGDQARLDAEELQFSYTKIVAPISGRAGAINIRAGNLVQDNGSTLVTILQLSPIYVSFGVPEQLLPQVQGYSKENPLLVTASGDGEKPATGKLVFIDNSIDTTTGTVKLKAQFDNPDEMLWPGEFVNTEMRLQMQRNRVVIPSGAVENGPQGKYVWVMDPATQTVAMRPVEIARDYRTNSGEEAVIGSGLRPGEMVISEGQMRLFPGSKVRLLKPAAQLSDTGQHTATDAS